MPWRKSLSTRLVVKRHKISLYINPFQKTRESSSPQYRATHGRPVQYSYCTDSLQCQSSGCGRPRPGAVHTRGARRPRAHGNLTQKPARQRQGLEGGSRALQDRSWAPCGVPAWVWGGALPAERLSRPPPPPGQGCGSPRAKSPSRARPGRAGSSTGGTGGAVGRAGPSLPVPVPASVQTGPPEPRARTLPVCPGSKQHRHDRGVGWGRRGGGCLFNKYQ